MRRRRDAAYTITVTVPDRSRPNDEYTFDVTGDVAGHDHDEHDMTRRRRTVATSAA